MRRRQKGLIIILVLALTCPFGAAGTPPGASSEMSYKASDDDRLPIYQPEIFRFFMSPYIWIPGLNITTESLKSADVTNVAWWDVASTFFPTASGAWAGWRPGKAGEGFMWMVISPTLAPRAVR
jgi:hypothetical protein